MGQAESYEREVRVGRSLSEGEAQHVNWRKENILLCLEELGLSCTEDEVPNIALLGSGGGLRAMVALLGSLCQLSEEGLLDSIMYLGGVSGSTWCMASLYKQPEWSIRMDSVRDDIIERLLTGEVTFQDQLERLVKYSTKENFSLTDVWAVYLMTTLKEIDDSCVTEQWEEHSEDPYPIYTVIDTQCRKKKLNKDVWFEITPHEAGYSLSGAFVETSMLGSEFDIGRRTKVCPEDDMLYLQGLCGSALAKQEVITDWILYWIKNLVLTAQSTSAGPEADLGCQILTAVLNLNLCTLNKKESHITTIKDLMKGKRFHDTGVYPGIWMLEGKVTQTEIVKFTQTACSSFPDWFSGCDSVVAIAKAIVQVLNWTWGKMYNYLHGLTVNDAAASVLTSKTREYQDAALLLNSPYLPLLREERNIDLIISLDFSNGDPFETVDKTVELCKSVDVAFPDVMHMHNPEPQDFYVYKGKADAPAVIHIPLFNAVNCTGEVEKWKEKYSTSTLHYTADMITDLMEKAALNISNNKEKLLREIKNAVEQKIRAKMEQETEAL